MKYKLSLIVVLLCFTSLGLYAQNGFLPKGSRIVKGSIGFSSSKQTSDFAFDLPTPYYQPPSHTIKQRTLNVSIEYSTLLNKTIYIGPVGSISTQKTILSAKDFETEATNVLADIGVNFGFLFGNTPEKMSRVLPYVSLSPRFLFGAYSSYYSNSLSHYGYSAVANLGLLIRLKERVALDTSVSGHFQSIYPTSSFYGKNAINGFLLNINLGITGLLSKK